MPLALRNLVHLARSRVDHPNGSILLLTVSTQSVAIMALRLFPGPLLIRRAALVLIAAGVVSYLAGLALILRRYLGFRDWRLVTDWSSTNCILHGALSITGLAAVVTGVFAASAMTFYWFWRRRRPGRGRDDRGGAPGAARARLRLAQRRLHL